MEKFTQYRDKGTQIAPYLPIRPEQPLSAKLLGIFLFLSRLPIILGLVASYFLVIQWLGSFCRKTWLWGILLVSGIWPIDFGVEGVRRGNLSKTSDKLPPNGTSTVIVCSYTSPLDVLYLATTFDPIFTASYPTTTLVEKVSLLTGLLRAFSPPRRAPPKGVELVTLKQLQQDHPNRHIALFPEGTTTNGRGILRFTPSINAIDKKTPIFPINLRYSLADVTTPIPRSYLTFLWYWLGSVGHSIRVRVGNKMFNDDEDNGLESEDEGTPEEETGSGSTGSGADQSTLSPIARNCAEKLATLGRIRTLNLGVQEKVGFVGRWTNSYGRAW
ncbi:hypothetical protein BJ508DRAFT_410306 [Ascobolus immersus RN42]|uniref:Phospholipid/glycerol acyltransferase domain-containing protein n=1 Tax=Ascobolus immersus RN42 TaxID=1160509 RepID=A0A3N4IN39_ASCIM|nr:hypothetical protein BJ508DRAFT_410306 [Ascobolus immersus RN42]